MRLECLALLSFSNLQTECAEWGGLCCLLQEQSRTSPRQTDSTLLFKYPGSLPNLKPLPPTGSSSNGSGSRKGCSPDSMVDSNSAQPAAGAAIESKPNDCIVAVDPGRSKCGLAVVLRNGDVPFRSVVNTMNMAAELARVISVYRPREIIVGDGTGSKQTIDTICTALSTPLPIRKVPEDFTSEEARKRCLRDERPRGLQRLLPPSLRTPSRLYDDYVAVILGERYWLMEIETTQNFAEVQ